MINTTNVERRLDASISAKDNVLAIIKRMQMEIREAANNGR